MATNYDEIRARYAAAGQDHVFHYMEELSVPERGELIKQLEGIELERLDSLLKAARVETADESVVEPFPHAVARSTDKDVVDSVRSKGIEAIRKGQVAALVLAGGQGTRLGYDGPKGMYDIGLPSGRTLFAMMAQRIKRLIQIARDSSSSDECNDTVALPFYIMTSPLNHAATVDYFKANDYFGLGQDSVFMFQQGMLPCMTEQGKIIMESRNKVAMAPDGNGGVYASLLQSGALAKMTSQGVKYLHVFSIDNALVNPADPVFIGYCLAQGADCGNKVVWKAHAHEKVGVVASKAGKACIVEYSEISTEMAERTDEKGRFVFGAANICNHFYTIDFIQDKILASITDLYHIAHKKIPYYDKETRKTITPTDNNGIKLETFIFDVFPLCEKMAVMDVERSEEFAPVKNKPGSPSDSPDTARAMISDLAKTRVKAAGGVLTGQRKRVARTEEVDDDDEKSNGDNICEISPLISYSGEGLETLVKGKDIHCPFRLEPLD
jgi:UDP-N-acetylglucosamine/UDP-N-acetylgalactosamine diphosphorylase